MRLEKQNRRSCLGLIIFVALLTALVLWMSLGGMPRDTAAEQPKGTVAPGAPPPGSGPPPKTR
jgi:hypothetical protein